ncbi:hypothetical protein LJC45_03320 [Alistipes sp. OttesenSCG-928-B03]|nr:hypothetical protein [Alistipes sp. OttesenSCG-928-B03]
MNIKTSDLLNVFADRYGINKNYLAPYRDELNELVTESEDYANKYKENELIVLSETTKLRLIRFQQTNNKLFTEIIMKINDA